MNSGRLTMYRNAWRTFTSLNGATSVRMVNGSIAPVCDGTAVIPLVFCRIFIWVPVSCPVQSMALLTRAFWTAVGSWKSMIVTESRWGRPAFQ